MIQPEPEDLPKDNPKLEIAVLSHIKFLSTDACLICHGDAKFSIESHSEIVDIGIGGNCSSLGARSVFKTSIVGDCSGLKPMVCVWDVMKEWAPCYAADKGPEWKEIVSFWFPECDGAGTLTISEGSTVTIFAAATTFSDRNLLGMKISRLTWVPQIHALKLWKDMVGEDNSSREKIGSFSSKKTKEVSKRKLEHVMDAVNGNIEGVCFAFDREENKGRHKEGRPLSAPVELEQGCYVALCWSMIRKQSMCDQPKLKLKELTHGCSGHYSRFEKCNSSCFAYAS
ncbi:hypothetical protein Tco_0894371 [Tanacetum coccineum]|uniref:Uncharacterized protein n=1 Tax=Tanacetum coccineum TaxID=301880 RepID=A0ABQ5CH06_9ASTR